MCCSKCTAITGVLVTCILFIITCILYYAIIFPSISYVNEPNFFMIITVMVLTIWMGVNCRVNIRKKF